MRYIINFVGDKLCLKKSDSLDELLNEMILINDYLSEIKNESFFYFGKNVELIYISFNNPKFYNMLKDVKNYGN